MKKLIAFCFFVCMFFVGSSHFVLAADGSISGTVKHVNNTPVEGVPIYFIDTDTDNYVTYAETNSSGTYSVNIAPGDYTVYNISTTDVDPHVVLFTYTYAVTVGSGEAKTQNFTLPVRARLKGHIHESDGVTGIDNASLTLNHVDGSSFGYAYDSSAANGQYYTSPVSSGVGSASATGLYNLYVTRAGYFGASVTNINLAADDHTYIQDINLTAASTVSGKIINASGNPVSGVTVSLREIANNYFYHTYTDVTGADGKYSISVYDLSDYNGTAVGIYSLAVSKNGFIAQSSNITIAADESTLSNNNFTLAKSGKVVGTVSKHNGKIAGATIIATDGYGNTYSTVSANNGSYALESLRPSLNYTISASKGNYVGATLYNVEVVGGQTSSPKNFTLAAAKSFSGTIKNKGGSKLEGATVSLYSRSKVRSETADYTATTDRNGSFSFTTIVPGDYRLKVSKAGYITYKKDVIGIGSNITGKTYTLEPGSSIWGRVTYDGKAVVGASVYVYGAYNDKDLSYVATMTDNNGWCKVDNLKAAEYKVKVLTTQYAFRVVGTTLASGKRNEVNVGLAKAGFISGYVLDRDTGLPLSGYLVKVQNLPITAYTDSNGYYILDGLAAGSYKIYSTSLLYKTQYFTGTEDPASASSIAVSVDKITTGRNFSLIHR